MQRLVLPLAALALILQAAPPPPRRARRWTRCASRRAAADAGGDACTDFNLTAAQARYFLARAGGGHARAAAGGLGRAAVLRARHGALGQRRVALEIRAGGTATLETPAGDSELRACTGCEIVLGRPAGKRR